MSSGATLRRGRRRPGIVLVVPLVSIVILVLGWSVLWGVARWEALSRLDAALVVEATHGRVWSCPERAVTGYPFRIALSCQDLTFEGRVNGVGARGTLPALSAEAWLYEPSSIYFAVSGPLSLTTADGRADFSLGWSHLDGTLRGLVGGMKRVELVVEDATLTRPNGEGGTVRRGEVHAGPAPTAGDGAKAVDITLSGLAVPSLDVLTGNAAPLDVLFSGAVTRAFGDLPDFGTATVERWRQDGGRLEIAKLVLSKDASSLAASGTLGIDDLHRLQGRLDASLAGFEPLARRFGIPLRAVDVGGLLANLLGQAPAAAPGALALPIIFTNGALAVGPFKTGLRLTPLY